MNSATIRLTLLAGICASFGMTGCITITNTFTGLPPGQTPQVQSQQMAAGTPPQPQYIYVYPTPTYPPPGYDGTQYGYYPSYPREYSPQYPPRYRDDWYDHDHAYYPPPSSPQYREHYPPVTSTTPQRVPEKPTGYDGVDDAPMTAERPYERPIDNDPPASTTPPRNDATWSYEHQIHNDPPASPTDATPHRNGTDGDHQTATPQQPITPSRTDASRRTPPIVESTQTASRRERGEPEGSTTDGRGTPATKEERTEQARGGGRMPESTTANPVAVTPRHGTGTGTTATERAKAPTASAPVASTIGSAARRPVEKKDTVAPHEGPATPATEQKSRTDAGTTPEASTSAPAPTGVSAAPRRQIEAQAEAPRGTIGGPSPAAMPTSGGTITPSNGVSERGASSSPR